MSAKMKFAARLANYVERASPVPEIAASIAVFFGTRTLCEYLIVGEYGTGIIDERKEQRTVSERPSLEYQRLDDKLNKLMDKVTQLEKKK
ncbi:hypothetical protein ACHQM5_012241 [Ranunculus cassubicifolius]